MSTETHEHTVNIHDVEPIWEKLGFDSRDVAEIHLTPYQVTVTTYVRTASIDSDYSKDHLAVCRCSWCTTNWNNCSHGGLMTVNHSFPVVYPEQAEHNEKLRKEMEADAAKFENVELS